MKKIYIGSVKAEFAQDKDGDDAGCEMQTLTVEMTHCGGSPYLVLETGRWALDEVDELTDLLFDFKNQAKPLFKRNEE